MEPAIVLIIFEVLVSTTVLKFQSFTRTIARRVVGDGIPTGATYEIQECMSPRWLVARGVVCLGLAGLSAHLGFSVGGWQWVGIVVALNVLTVPLSTIWPFPSLKRCHATARSCAVREMMSSDIGSERRQLCSKILMQLMFTSDSKPGQSTA